MNTGAAASGMTEASAADHLHREFEAAFGYSAEGCFRAPGRVNLIGEHTDYSGGLVLPIAIDRAVYVAIGRRESRRGGSEPRGPDSWEREPVTTARAAPGRIIPAESAETIRVVSTHQDEQGNRLEGRFTAEELAPGALPGWLSHPAGVVDEIRRSTGTTISGVDICITSTVPVGAGLSSSHALEVAVLMALDDLFDLRFDDREKIFLTQRAENDFVGAPTGIVDQAASIMGRAGHALFLDCRDLRTRQIPFDLDSHGLVLMVIDTRVIHSHSQGGYGARRRTCEEAANALHVTSLREITDSTDLSVLNHEQAKRVAHVRSENRRVVATVDALDHGDVRRIGEHLLSSHESLARDYEVSCPELDCAVAAAMEAGALGARMTGGGFGGSAIALVDTDRFEPISRAVLAAFSAAGYRVPQVFAVSAGSGAGRLDD